MLRHLATLLWNTRRSNGLLAAQILLAFLVLFGVFTFLARNFDHYSTPLGFRVDDAYIVDVFLPQSVDTVVERKAETMEQLRRELAGLPDVVDASLLGFIEPFSDSGWGFGTDLEEEGGRYVWTRMYVADEHYPDVAGIELARGRWFTPADTIGGRVGAVVTQQMLDENFPGRDMLGEETSLFSMDDSPGARTTVVGVVERFKYRSEFAEEEPLTFLQDVPWNTDRSAYYYGAVQVRTSPGAPADIEEQLFEAVAAVTKNRESVVQSLEFRRERTSRAAWLPLVILLTICGFLVVNVALGLFGVLINAIARRRGEIGLRKALGATGGNVTAQLTGEVVLVAAVGLILGSLLAFQLAYLEIVPFEAKYLWWGGLSATGLILGIVVACALLPSSQAARIHPAVALREE